MIDKKCENCIWFDQCRDNEVCNNYDPVSFEEQELIDVAEYEENLYMRQKYYQAQIFEQNE